MPSVLLLSFSLHFVSCQRVFQRDWNCSDSTKCFNWSIKGIIFTKALFFIRTPKLRKDLTVAIYLFLLSHVIVQWTGDFGCPENQYTAMVVVVFQLERSLMRLPGEAQNRFLEEENSTAWVLWILLGLRKKWNCCVKHETSCLQLFSLQATKTGW